jgi:hypothetical protein
MTERDFETNPYSHDELRVVGYLAKIIPEAGAGDDPIGFLMASHNVIVDDRREQTRIQKSYFDDHSIEGMIPPRDKEDVVEVLMRVQVGAMSCRKAASLLFPQFNRDSPTPITVMDALSRLVTAVDWEGIYIANESTEAEVQRRANILLKCNEEARAVLKAGGGE